jgi:tripartite-type tricarboxylate transporter receptor subunit TctC
MADALYAMRLDAVKPMASLRLSVLWIPAFAGMTAFVSAPLVAQSYPSKPVRIIVPYPPGGGVDVVARVVGRKLTDTLGQPIVVENRGGAAGVLGADMVAKAPPDGYTIGLMTSSLLMAPVLQKVPYDTARDFAPVILFATVSNILVVHPSLPVKSLQDVMSLARARPGELTHATSGAGSVPHLMMELLRTMVPRFDIVHVPYKGNAQAITDLLGGHITMHISSMLSATPYVKSGQLRAIAVTAGKRSRAAPQVPTFAESGAPGYDVTSLWGFSAPGATPPEIVNRLYGDIAKILRYPDVNEQLAGLGADISGAGPQEYGALMKAELAKWPKVVAAAKIKAD